MSLLLTLSIVSIFNFEHVIAKLPFLERDIHVTYVTLPDSVKKWIFLNFFFAGPTINVKEFKKEGNIRVRKEPLLGTLLVISWYIAQMSL